jgi:SAM-dependent methyltransferase
VTAVEPDAAMLAELRRGLPPVSERPVSEKPVSEKPVSEWPVTALPGSAERIPLDDGSVDAVLCGQAMHWFDMSRALPEIARVLVPGGTLAALWNCDDDRVPWVAGLQEATEGAARPPVTRRRQEAAGSDIERFGTALFGPTEVAEFPNFQRLTADALVAAIGTHSQLLVMEPERRARLLAKVRDYLAAQPETADGEFEMPLVTWVIRSVRR